ncbi:MAG: hypothetical protein FWE94_01120 [Coriobacteriia bacterium]|nr:hypothetical protein [Coriobacteriia bacterium]
MAEKTMWLVVATPLIGLVFGITLGIVTFRQWVSWPIPHLTVAASNVPVADVARGMDADSRRQWAMNWLIWTLCLGAAFAAFGALLCWALALPLFTDALLVVSLFGLAGSSAPVYADTVHRVFNREREV